MMMPLIPEKYPFCPSSSYQKSPDCSAAVPHRGPTGHLMRQQPSPITDDALQRQVWVLLGHGAPESDHAMRVVPCWWCYDNPEEG